MHALLVSTFAVAIAEIGDKTQLLSLLLAARYRRPLPIVLGILVATLLNHALAAALGAWVAEQLAPHVLRALLALSFLAVALWALKPDTLEEAPGRTARSAFLATTIAFFVAETGDKTQVATIVLAAQYDSTWLVVAGSTLGMLAANVPVVLLGERLAQRLPLRAVRNAAAALFVLLAGVVWLR
jgi:Ca2+/H+ antiporter, TMEM165/GDT1 family